MFKVKHNLCPEFIQNIFHQKNSTTRSKANFHRPTVNTVYNGEQSLRYFGPIVRDKMLPENIKQITDLGTFKREVKNWVPDNCPCRLCKDFVPQLGFVTLFESMVYDISILSKTIVANN